MGDPPKMEIEKVEKAANKLLAKIGRKHEGGVGR
jgi:hypothetical protein